MLPAPASPWQVVQATPARSTVPSMCRVPSNQTEVAGSTSMKVAMTSPWQVSQLPTTGGCGAAGGSVWQVSPQLSKLPSTTVQVGGLSRDTDFLFEVLADVARRPRFEAAGERLVEHVAVIVAAAGCWLVYKTIRNRTWRT